MSLFVASLNSGSNGNCYFIGSTETAILVDAGLSCRETEKRLKRLGRSLRNIDALFITHEHGDHIHGLEAIARKYRIPVYISPPTLSASRIEIDRSLVRGISTQAPMIVNDIEVTAIKKFHDAEDPYSFIVARNGVRVGVYTDLGYPCEKTVETFSQCHAAFLESNYEDDLLERGSYPYHLKQRIKGDRGHLSNAQALKLFKDHRSEYLSHLFLSHLSEDNNHPRLVQNTFNREAGETEIVVASRHKETRLYHIRAGAGSPKRMVEEIELMQLSLF